MVFTSVDSLLKQRINNITNFWNIKFLFIYQSMCSTPALKQFASIITHFIGAFWDTISELPHIRPYKRTWGIFKKYVCRKTLSILKLFRKLVWQYISFQRATNFYQHVAYFNHDCFQKKEGKVVIERLLLTLKYFLSITAVGFMSEN